MCCHIVIEPSHAIKRMPELFSNVSLPYEVFACHHIRLKTATMLLVGKRLRYRYRYDIQIHGPLLLTWVNLIPAWISNHMPNKVWNEILMHSETSTLDRWCLRMNNWFHPTLYNQCNHISMQWFKLTPFSKLGPRGQPHQPFRILTRYTYVHTSRDAYKHILYVYIIGNSIERSQRRSILFANLMC